METNLPKGAVLAACAFLFSFLVLLPGTTQVARHGDESQYVWSAGYFTGKLLSWDWSRSGTDPVGDPGWAPQSYWALTQPMGTRFVYGLAMAVTGQAPPAHPVTTGGNGQTREADIAPGALAATRTAAVLCAALAFAVLAGRLGWSGFAAVAILLVPDAREDLSRAWAEGPLLLGLALAIAACGTRWFAPACGLAATFKLTALGLWPLVFLAHPLGRSRFARLLGLAPAALTWSLLTPPSWHFGGPLYLGAMLANRATEQAYLSEVYGGPLGAFFPNRYALPLEVFGIIGLAWMTGRLALALRHRRVLVLAAP